jgi:hypothetical protein
VVTLLGIGGGLAGKRCGLRRAGAFLRDLHAAGRGKVAGACSPAATRKFAHDVTDLLGSRRGHFSASVPAKALARQAEDSY